MFYLIIIHEVSLPREAFWVFNPGKYRQVAIYNKKSLAATRTVPTPAHTSTAAAAPFQV